MELVERYLQAVNGYLPKPQAADIIAELKDSLLSQIEERESALGRALTEAEQQALLKQSGHPLLVAGRYLPQQHLIGPSVFPLWWYSQRLMLTIIGIVYGVLAGIDMVSSHNPVQSLMQAAFGYAGTALVYMAIITLLFWLFERYQVRLGFLDNWQPAKLAPVKDRLHIKRSEALFELVVGVLFLFWWCGWLKFPALFIHDDAVVPFQLASAWTPYWWPILALGIADVVLAGINLLRPYWSRDRLLLHILLNVIGIGLSYALFQHDVLVTVAAAGVQAGVDTLEIGRYGNVAVLLNKLVHGVLVVLMLVYVIEMIADIRRLLRYLQR
ncbi:hypothetical protein HPT27_02920 [Permianibacter sp. IMCC34836]|uniref:hypothetical protein n=1 Tax=Permianibacter fluminis TaxID=2738515 RepID=UPI001552CDCD|nr:hypothetical protein [Permianibacter fluminis]NQD35959.1 hypothetical protein [Permianibacter fluminis]